jgi:Flp pilus assembly protein TadD
LNRPIEGYVADPTAMAMEYQHYYGKVLANSDVEGWFNQASQQVRKKDYATAVVRLEQVAKVAAVPLVFNNLGVLYAQLNDKSRAINAFREALARDVDYRQVRVNLDRMRDIVAMGAEPVSREVEPNNNMTVANVMTVGRPVDGEIAASVGDVDFFRLTTPPAPRDLIAIEITNKSKTLAPVLKIFNEDGRITNWGQMVREPGADLKETISPPPNAILYLQVSGYGSSAGSYTLLVHPLKAFDEYEPNDDIYRASRIELGKETPANIMDADDTDFYSFVSPRAGTVSVVVTNKSATLVPALSTFYPDKRSSGFGPDVRTPGLNLRHTIDVLENQIYYIQVWSQSNTTGPYTLLVE